MMGGRLAAGCVAAFLISAAFAGIALAVPPDDPGSSARARKGRHRVRVQMFHVAGSDAAQERLARKMARTKQRELLACYRKVPPLGSPLQRGERVYSPIGHVIAGLETDALGRMHVVQVHPVHESLRQCFMRAFDGKPSPFPGTRMIVDFQFDRPGLAPPPQGDDLVRP
jgi:hypothetical protein